MEFADGDAKPGSQVKGEKHTLRVVRQNYALALGVNVLRLLAEAGGAINLVLAALLHNASSIAVVSNFAQLINHTPTAPNSNHRHP